MGLNVSNSVVRFNRFFCLQHVTFYFQKLCMWKANSIESNPIFKSQIHIQVYRIQHLIPAGTNICLFPAASVSHSSFPCASALSILMYVQTDRLAERRAAPQLRDDKYPPSRMNDDTYSKNPSPPLLSILLSHSARLSETKARSACLRP